MEKRQVSATKSHTLTARMANKMKKGLRALL
jgi:hypothetical protein